MQAILAAASLLILVVNSHPICTSGTNQGSKNTSMIDKGYADNITADVVFFDKWLDLSDSSKGIEQLRRHSRNSMASTILYILQNSTSVSNFSACMQ